MPIAIELVPTLPTDGSGTAEGAPVQVVGVGVFSDGFSSGYVPHALDHDYLDGQGFTGKAGQTCVVPDGVGHTVVAVGLGPEPEATTASYRLGAAALARAGKRQARVAATFLDAVPDRLDAADVAQAIAEGFVLGTYRYAALKSDTDVVHIEALLVVGPGDQRVAAALARGQAIADAVCLARDLVNEPGGTLTPTAFALRAEELAAAGGFRAEVLDQGAIEDEKLGGLLGVNRGSTEAPRFVKLVWEPAEPRATVALVGKGITFDSGGLTLKPGESMVGMKGDMAGAAAVLAAFTTFDVVRPPVRVLGFLPLTDNMPGGDAMRVGDVLRIRNGATVEVLNTDAEGRLVLADALSLAGETEPDAVVDLATLTGACMVALGLRIAGLMGNDDDLVAQVRQAAEAAGEPVWPLPLPDDLRSQLDSDVADMKNIGSGRWAGALVAGLFLERFVPAGTPWVHLDIAGPAEAHEDSPESPKGGTGFGVRTLIGLLSDFRPQDQ